MYNHLYEGDVEVDGECSPDEVEVNPHLAVQLAAEEVFNQRNGPMTTVLPACAGELHAEDGGGIQGHVDGVYKCKRSHGSFRAVRFDKEGGRVREVAMWLRLLLGQRNG